MDLIVALIITFAAVVLSYSLFPKKELKPSVIQHDSTECNERNKLLQDSINKRWNAIDSILYEDKKKALIK